MADFMAPLIASKTSMQDRSTAAIAAAATRTGVDFSYLYHQARIESGLNPNAKASTSSATGLYQFINQSWLGVVDKHGADHGLGWAAHAIERGPNGRYFVRDPKMRQAIMELRKNPEAAAVMAGEFAADNRAYLEQRTGQTTAPVDLYLAHFLGPAGAAKFLSAHHTSPGQSAASLFPEAARANRAIFYAKGGAPRSLDAVRNLFAHKLAGNQTGRFEPRAPLSPPLPKPGGPALPQALTVPAAASDNHVLPSDYMRIAGQLNSQNLGTAVQNKPILIGKGEARLAYLMLASMGLSLGASA
jgi:hypothetical protein